MTEPSLKCVDLVYEELLRIVKHCVNLHDMHRFPHVSERINEVTSNLIRDHVEPTRDSIRNLVEMHCAYINTKHPDFVDCLQEKENENSDDEDEYYNQEEKQNVRYKGLSEESQKEVQKIGKPFNYFCC